MPCCPRLIDRSATPFFDARRSDHHPTAILSNTFFSKIQRVQSIPMTVTFTTEEVSKHNQENDCWIIINGNVYDVTKFLSTHPGGKKILLKEGGKDASAQFAKFHDVQKVLQFYDPKLKIGSVAQKQSTPSSSEKQSLPSSSKKLFNDKLYFGEMVPFGDPSWYQGCHSPPGYYNESHQKLRLVVRQWVDKHVIPYCDEWETKKNTPRSVLVSAYEHGILPGVVHVTWPEVKYAGSKVAGGIRPEEFDAFHYLILLDEIARCGSGGVVWGIIEGIQIGLPPILHYFKNEKKREIVLKECMTGAKTICLAITEPGSGSDVASISTVAKKSPCGKFYVVNGEKKWITNGMFADYFTVAVKTEDDKISLLLMERGMKGLETKQMHCMGMHASGTAYVTFEDVQVDVNNLIGVEGDGFKYIMQNFNYERLGFCIQSNRFSRVCYEEAYKYAHKRKTFGKNLVDHQVIRYKLAEMARQIESNWSHVEYLTYQMKCMTHEESSLKLSGPIALAKVQNTKMFEYCAREAAQIFGGLSYSKGGQGEKVERLYRDVRAMAIPGGSEEIMLDFGIKQHSRILPRVSEKAAKM